MNTHTLTMSRSWMLAGWITIFLVGTDLFVVSPFLPAIGLELHREPASLTMMVSIFSIVYAIACPIQARLAERIGINNILLFGITLIGAANVYTALANDIPGMLLSRALAGLGAASISPMIYALTADRSVPHERAGKLALINSGLIIALILGAPLGLVLGSYSGWRLVFSLLGLAFFLTLPVNVMAWKNGDDNQPVRGPARKPSQEKLSDGIVFFLAMICWSSSVYATYTLLSSALTRDYHASTGMLATTLTCYGIGAALGGILGGKLADRIGAINMVRIAFMLMLAMLAIMPSSYASHRIPVLSLNLFLLALSAYGFFPALQACTANVFTARRPTVMGLLSSSLYIGITLGSGAGGILFARDGMNQVVLFSVAASAIGLALSFRIRNTTQVQRNASRQGI